MVNTNIIQLYNSTNSECFFILRHLLRKYKIYSTNRLYYFIIECVEKLNTYNYLWKYNTAHICYIHLRSYNCNFYTLLNKGGK